jgi:HD-GYP domain-containing protein (c-di-GMP phosphodiesterase class II)
VTEQGRRIEQLFLASMQSLADALEVKDPYTRGHSVRVSHYASLASRALGLDQRTIHQIELGGHVHDIGKIGVREAVLNKPGPLTADEYAHIMTHPVVGWRILAPLLADAPGASAILNVVRWHHERYDGRGIPDALAGEAIPLEARIICCCDSWNAMRTDRPYRNALSHEVALTELVSNAGSQFDPRVVDALLEVVDPAGMRGASNKPPLAQTPAELRA